MIGGTPVKIQFLIEATKTSGLGRVRRSAVLAQELAAMHAEVCCLQTTSPMAQPLLDLYNIPQVPAINPDSDIIIIDGSPEYQLSVMDHLPPAKLVVIDDIANCRLQADVIINPNIYARQLDYSYLGYVKLLRGPNYHLLDPSFFASNHKKNTKVQRDIDILITFGGSDTREYIQAIAKAFDPYLDQVTIRIASPSPLQKSVCGNIPVLVGEDMQKLLLRSHLYLGGAGVTAMEALAADCQLVLTRVAPDQHMNSLSMRMQGVDVCDIFDPDIMVSMAQDCLANPRDYDLTLMPTGLERTAKALLS